MQTEQIIGLIVFFIIIFVCFTLFPRLVLTFINRLLEFVGWKSFRGFLKNAKDMILLYVALAIPFTIILYQSPLRGSFGVIFTAIFLFLVAIRLSILLRKKELLGKIGFDTSWLKWAYHNISRKDLREEYKSYLFDVFFSAFTIGILIWCLQILFSPQQTILYLPPINVIGSDIISNLGKYAIYGTVFIGVILVSECTLKYVGSYNDVDFL